MTIGAALRLLAVMILWAFCFSLITMGLDLAPHPAFAALRAVPAGVRRIALGLLLHRPIPVGGPSWILIVLVGLGATSMGFFGMFYAAEFVSPGLATVIVNVQPIIAAVLAHVCVTLDRLSLCEALEQEAADPEFCEAFIRPKTHLFANVPVFLSASGVAGMQQVVAAIEATARLASYKTAVLSWAPEIAREDHKPVGALMGYDFHSGVDRPRLIEINTNAGGAFLNALLARAQRACCAEMAIPQKPHTFEDAAVRMFQDEWTRQRGTGVAHRIAIVDDMPEEQYLYPEFVLVRQVLAAHGIDAVIADAGRLRYERGLLSVEGKPIDLVYNRVTDFAFDQPEHRALRDAYRDGAVVVTPLCQRSRPLLYFSSIFRVDGMGQCRRIFTGTQDCCVEADAATEQHGYSAVVERGRDR